VVFVGRVVRSASVRSRRYRLMDGRGGRWITIGERRPAAVIAGGSLGVSSEGVGVSSSARGVRVLATVAMEGEKSFVGCDRSAYSESALKSTTV